METRHYPGKRRRTPASAIVLIGLVLTGCGTADVATRPARPSHPTLPSSWPSVAPNDPVGANAVSMRALSLVGTPYRYGGNTPEAGFDCSGLVGYVFHDMLARPLPRSSTELARFGAPIRPDRLATGDLVVFGAGSSATHVGIYVGEGRFVHAPSTGGTVRLDRLDGPYWREHFLGGRRVLM